MSTAARPLAVLLIAATLLLVAMPARAVSLLRDADIEYALGELAAPVLRAAGLSPSQVQVLVVHDSSLNAFIADTQHIFIHSGLIMKLDSAAALQAVIAHEAAHITNGHITRRLGNMRSARTASALGMLLAAATGAATGNGDAMAGVLLGTQSAAMRNFLAHTRAEESSADLTSIRTLIRAGIDPQGALDVQELFRGQEALSSSRQDPYMLTHPLTRDRLRALKGLVAAAGDKARDDPEADYWFARTRAKLSAFLRAPNWTLRRLDRAPSRDIALMSEAVARHRQSDLTRALKSIDGAIALRPRDPFLHDLKGQILLESRKAGPAVQVYDQARRLAPRNAQILGGLGRAQLAAGQYSAALRTLEEARGRDWRDSRVLRDLAVAYAKTGNPGMASEATAQRYALEGRPKDAGIHAKRALGLLPRGSAPWRRAQDVLDAAERAAKAR
ncbi:M48 family metalloprotease [Salipiger sp. P9]|uniref:M48 family metalloprotease n=1 Tax=Salipiger pentaromativorans TaxID=2943193 RepID=UPI002157D11A|nr:M48 family metalloprotease [Salipiger pentaromativorans]MCR8546310.1 M48 family metalloprotease [Salipiger pentaromativorans]